RTRHREPRAGAGGRSFDGRRARPRSGGGAPARRSLRIADHAGCRHHGRATPVAAVSDSTLRGVLRTIEREYVETLREYLSGAGEAALAGAYDLGRRAVLMHVSLL